MSIPPGAPAPTSAQSKTKLSKREALMRLREVIHRRDYSHLQIAKSSQELLSSITVDTPASEKYRCYQHVHGDEAFRELFRECSMRDEAELFLVSHQTIREWRKPLSVELLVTRFERMLDKLIPKIDDRETRHDKLKDWAAQTCVQVNERGALVLTEIREMCDLLLEGRS
jgi:hypothetical protein